MSRYTCYKCKVEHGTDNMVAYCAACYSDLRAQLAAEKERADRAEKRIEGFKYGESELARNLESRAEAAEAALAKVRDNEASAIVALTKASARADAAEDTAASAFDGMRIAKNRAEAAEAALAKVQEELDDIKESYADTIKEACDPPAKDDRVHCSCVPALRREVAALTEKVAAYKMESEQDRKELDGANARCHLLEEQVAGLTAWVDSVRTVGLGGGVHSLSRLMREAEEIMKDTAPILAAHDAAKQAELVEALRANTQRCGHLDLEFCPSCKSSLALLAKYSKAAKEDA